MVVLGGSPAGALQPPAASRVARDSVRNHAAAVAALRQFEHQHGTLVRRPGAVMLPPLFPVIGECELRVGDYCYGPRNGGLALGGIGTTPDYQSLADFRYIPSYRLRSSRYIGRYTSLLASYRRNFPGDRWINGEMARVELERARPIDAMELLDGCKSDEWWCNALRAYTIHSTGLWRRADTLWTVVLAQMPESERCAWLDPTLVVDSEAFERHYRELTCAEQIRLAERVWWLSDPFFSIDGNERRAEHLARQVALILQQGYREHRIMTPAMALNERAIPLERPMVVARTAGSNETETIETDRLTWARGTMISRAGYPELVLRAGVPLFTAPGDGGTIAQYEPDRIALVPKGEALLDHLSTADSDWDILNQRPYEFLSSWPKPMRQLEYQQSYFTRGDSVRLIAASDFSRDSVLAFLEVLGSLTLQKDFDRPALTQEYLGRNLVRFDLTLPRDSTVASIEVMEVSGISGRVRFASAPPPLSGSLLSLSDVMLIDTFDPRPSDLEEARHRALGRTRLNTGSSVGLYWEMYGLRPGDEPEVSVVLTPLPVGFLSRVARTLTLQRAPDSVAVRFTEGPAAGNEVEARVVNLDLRTLREGDYHLSIQVNLPGGPSVVSTRGISIRDPEPFRWR